MINDNYVIMASFNDKFMHYLTGITSVMEWKNEFILYCEGSIKQRIKSFEFSSKNFLSPFNIKDGIKAIVLKLN